jgi:hypothetical protein
MVTVMSGCPVRDERTPKRLLVHLAFCRDTNIARKSGKIQQDSRMPSLVGPRKVYFNQIFADLDADAPQKS